MAHNKQVMRNLTLFGFFSLTASMVLTVYEYPTFATSKLHLVFFLILGGIFWFLPVALCAAEMATVEGWNQNGGGIFSWVSHTLGRRWGFAAIFFQWFQITVGFVTMIYFILGAFSYVIDWPALDSQPIIKFFGVLVVFWILTFSQFWGTKYTAYIAKIGFAIGILIPSLILFILAICYVVSGAKLQVSFSPSAFMPNFTKLNTLVVFVSFILAYMGVEASASHINELKNPRRNYPLAMFILVILAICLDTFGGFTVAAVVPQSELSLSAGVVQAFKYLLLHFNAHFGWIVKVIALMIALGVMAEISSWVIGPSRGLFATAQQGLLPPLFQKTNKHNVPVALIITQGIIVSIWDGVLTFGGGSNNVSFFVAISLTVVIYLVGYLLFFTGYLDLVFKKKQLKRTYSIPGGTVCKAIVAICGLLVSLFAFFISFVPPSNLPVSSHRAYLCVLIISFIVALLLPFAIYEFYSKHHDHKISTPKHLLAKDINATVPPIARGEHHITDSKNS
ncbi:glutamate:gamma-aminobutyrate antiporter [Limosilactobacillus fastidiosus]|uniref:Glutamate/gamma-aminobutyrate antiporter n=1 Tax=Limosilactobacillus fastidiosus TaxID=2759855 RepID=A0A7W3YCJ3_9LACO|nr:glutamate:gamma-aminobutyrate antiporter [Limosilactobacillus fastidiosus]MBB1062913.1 glutamate:gamma-aminobutyrate antiporter [Limosilactobacillus fastidiosus]MBB1086176.1 glutamate:gamma-aminobutyrate antiporter [Limosilactobacillus fastidiosus]MCD7083759.1 glutamate:gamma-aminobutyrate antiporter [Limosilactobacillus fastidiosus]MCD7085091.1 glutamate:gamma-aminobutyrate antiporter [Limosilactobacillus fastidiosus]MCD7114603.1 glutamate:gamma-aminobutyrate antiporter [Limosilactobacillu